MFFQNKSIKMILQVLLFNQIYWFDYYHYFFHFMSCIMKLFELKLYILPCNHLQQYEKNSNIGQLKIELSDSFDMTCSNFTNHRVVRNLKSYRCLYFVLCIVFSGAYSNCILENLVRIYQTGHNGTQNFIKSLFLYS